MCFVWINYLVFTVYCIRLLLVEIYDRSKPEGEVMIEASIVLYVIGATIFFIVAMFEAPEAVWFTPIWPLVY